MAAVEEASKKKRIGERRRLSLWAFPFLSLLIIIALIVFFLWPRGTRQSVSLRDAIVRLQEIEAKHEETSWSYPSGYFGLEEQSVLTQDGQTSQNSYSLVYSSVSSDISLFYQSQEGTEAKIYRGYKEEESYYVSEDNADRVLSSFDEIEGRYQEQFAAHYLAYDQKAALEGDISFLQWLSDSGGVASLTSQVILSSGSGDLYLSLSGTVYDSEDARISYLFLDYHDYLLNSYALHDVASGLSQQAAMSCLFEKLDK